MAASIWLAIVVGTVVVIAVQTRVNCQLATQNAELQASNIELDRHQLRAPEAECETRKWASELPKLLDFQPRMLAQFA